MNRRLWMLLVLALLCGCSRRPPANLPTVYKVVGTAVEQSTGKPLNTGTLQFEALDQSGHIALAEIQPDGRFVANTFVDGHRLEGTVAGPQRVTFIPRSTQDPGAKGPVRLPETVEVLARENDFRIEVPR